LTSLKRASDFVIRALGIDSGIRVSSFFRHSGLGLADRAAEEELQMTNAQFRMEAFEKL
jgi:hypothetical protein